MKAFIERYIRSQHTDQQIGMLKYQVEPHGLIIIFWGRPIHQTVEMDVLEFGEDEIIGIVEDDWKQKTHIVEKEIFLNWCVETFDADTAIDVYNNWK